MNNIITKKLPFVKGDYRENVILSKTNWFNVGGEARILYKPKDIYDLSNFIKNKPKEIDYVVIGCGSNLIVRDNGIDGVVIKLSKNFNYCRIENNSLIVGAGTLSYNLSKFALENDIKNFEFLIGIPGTIGGNIKMNAGCYGSEISDIIDYVTLIDEYGDIKTLKKEQINFNYRNSNLSDKDIFIEAVFNIETGSKEDIKSRMDYINTNRNDTQPIGEKTSGSTFKNPIGHKAWKLIDEAGCRGLKWGGAIVSEKHCNFLINNSNASANDLEMLGEEIIKRVFKMFGIKLEWEIKIIGK